MAKKTPAKNAKKEAVKAVIVKKPWLQNYRSIGYILAICGMIGVIAASVLLIEKMALLKNPLYQPSCNLNPIISCGSVMKTDQASVFGVSNSFVGIIGFTVVMTIGFAILAGAKFKKWFWQGLLLGSVFGVGFSMWLFYQGVYSIGAVCPYCAGIWLISIIIFVYTLLYNLQEKYIKTPARLKSVVDFAQRHHADIVLAWYLILVFLILNHFWYYWKTVF